MPSLKHQLRVVRDAADGFADWRFDGEIPVERRDESGVLAFALNRLGKLCGQIAPLSDKTFARLIQSGEMPPVNQTSEAVVLFCNIRSFSSVTQNLRPREKLDLVNSFFQKAGLCARLTGGHVDKHLGDKLIVSWGVFNRRGRFGGVNRHDQYDQYDRHGQYNQYNKGQHNKGGLRNNALAAIRAVLMARAYLGDWNRERMNEGLPPLHFSFGIDAGRVSLSPFFVNGSFEYSLTGAAVNNACRCEAATKKVWAETLLSENVYRLVERFVIAGEMPRIPAKPPLFALVNIREKRLIRLLSKDLARITDIDLPFALTLAGLRGPKTLTELRAALYLTPDGGS
jgi:class 3 adenylate cyclase